MVSNQGRRSLVLLCCTFEVKPDLDHLPPDMGLQFVVDPGLTVVVLKSRPHDTALGGSGFPQKRDGAVFGLEEEFTRFKPSHAR